MSHVAVSTAERICVHFEIEFEFELLLVRRCLNESVRVIDWYLSRYCDLYRFQPDGMYTDTAVPDKANASGFI